MTRRTPRTRLALPRNTIQATGSLAINSDHAAHRLAGHLVVTDQAASATAEGDVTTGPQDIAGNKRFVDGITLANHQAVSGVDDAGANPRTVVEYHDYSGYRTVFVGTSFATGQTVDGVLLEVRPTPDATTDFGVQDGLVFVGFDGTSDGLRTHAIYLERTGVQFRNYFDTDGPAVSIRGYNGADGTATTSAKAGGLVSVVAGPPGADLGGGGAAGGDLLLAATPGSGSAPGGVATLGALGTSVVLHTGVAPQPGDLYYVDAAGRLARLERGTSPDGSVLRLVGGMPAWVAP